MNNKGTVSNMWLYFCYTIQLITIKLCTKIGAEKSVTEISIGEKEK